MSERKVLNKYFPPDWDPALLPKGKRPKNKQINVRVMLPVSIQCKQCGEYIYKGKKFNARSEIAIGEAYLGIRVYRFYIPCTNCKAEITFKTDPKNSDYTIEHGATRNFEPWRANKEASEAEERARLEEEAGDAMKKLENKTFDNRREMEISDALEELKEKSTANAKLDTDSLIQKIANHANIIQLRKEEQAIQEEAMKAFFQTPSTFTQNDSNLSITHNNQDDNENNNNSNENVRNDEDNEFEGGLYDGLLLDEEEYAKALNENGPKFSDLEAEKIKKKQTKINNEATKKELNNSQSLNSDDKNQNETDITNEISKTGGGLGLGRGPGPGPGPVQGSGLGPLGSGLPVAVAVKSKKRKAPPLPPPLHPLDPSPQPSTSNKHSSSLNSNNNNTNNNDDDKSTKSVERVSKQKTNDTQNPSSTNPSSPTPNLLGGLLANYSSDSD